MSGATYLAARDASTRRWPLCRPTAPAPVAGGTDLVVGHRQGKAAAARARWSRSTAWTTCDGIAEAGGGLSSARSSTHDAIERADLVREPVHGAGRRIGHRRLAADPPRRHDRRQRRERLAGDGDRRRRSSCLGAEVDAALDGRRARPSRSMSFSPARPHDGRAPDEMLSPAIRVPGPAGGSGSCYVRLEFRRSMEIAVVGAAALVTLAATERSLTRGSPSPRSPRRSGRVAGGGGGAAIGTTAARTRRSPPPQLPSAAAAAPISDVRGSDGYRRAMAAVIARRAIDAPPRARPVRHSVPASPA